MVKKEKGSWTIYLLFCVWQKHKRAREKSSQFTSIAVREKNCVGNCQIEWLLIHHIRNIWPNCYNLNDYWNWKEIDFVRHEIEK